MNRDAHVRDLTGLAWTYFQGPILRSRRQIAGITGRGDRAEAHLPRRAVLAAFTCLGLDDLVDSARFQVLEASLTAEGQRGPSP